MVRTPLSFLRGGAVEPQDYDLACLGFVGHAAIVKLSATATFCTPSTVYVITPPPIPPPVRAALPEFLAGGRIQRVEIAAEVSDEHDSTGRRRDGGDKGIVDLARHFQTPVASLA